jgi:tetratricopeptide (TPR) repeat protein
MIFMLLEPVMAHLRFLMQLSALASGDRGRGRRLSGVVSETAGLAAWLYADLDDVENAVRHYRLAITAARDAEHSLLPAYMLASLGQYAVGVGDAGRGLQLIQQARASVERLPALAEVWFDGLEGLTRAATRDREAARFFDRAAARIDQANRDEPVWPWLFRFDAQKLDLHRATGAIQAGDWARALPLLTPLQAGNPKQAALVAAYRRGPLPVWVIANPR